MTYNQVQLFQINDYANNYVTLKIQSAVQPKYCIGRLTSWLGTVGPVDCFNRVFECYKL